MANPNDNLRRLYQNGLKHFSLPDFDTFQQDMRDEEKRKRFYNNMQQAYSLPDFDTFSQDIGAVTPPPAQPQAQAQPQQTTSTVKPVTDNTAQQASVQPTVQTSSQPAQPEGWKPTPMQQRAFKMQIDEANARLKKQGEEFKQRMEGIEKGNRPGAFMGEREFNPLTGKMETHYYTTRGERVGTRMEQSHANTEYHNWWENNTEAGKRSKEQRLQREFDEKLSYLWQRHNPAEGENAAEQAWSAAESAYNAKAERNREAANFNVQNFAMNSTDAAVFKQMETVDNFTDRLTTHDMDVLMDNAWNNLGEEGQKSLIDDCYQMLRRRNPGVDDLVLYGKAKEFARQQSDLRMYHLAVEKNLPKSNLEYFMRKVGDMNLVTNIGKGIAVNRVKKTGDMAAYEAANEQYRQDGHKILDVAGTVTGFALDPTTWLSAGVGGTATRGAMWAGGRVLAGRGATAAVTNAATRQFATSMTGRVIGGIAGGAANFGTFEGIKEMETQFAHGGHIVGQDDTGRYLNEGYSASAVAGQAAHGFLMGGAIGWLTPVSGNVADKLVRSTSSTGLKVMERAGVYSGATMLEGTIFSVPEWIEGNRDAMDVWTDNMAMMVGFKAKHMIKSAGNVLGDLKASFDSPTNGRKNRLDFESRLRQRMDAPSDGGLSLTKDEAAELSKHGYGDLRELVESAERTGDATKGELITANAPEIVSRLTDMVTDPRISEAARAKMYYYATGRKLPESTVMKGELIEDGEGGFIVESQGANGVITSRSFKSRKAADLELERIKRQTELNHIEIGERYQQTADFENRLQEACRTVAAENGWDMVEVYRTCEEARRNNLRGGDKQFDEAQQNILRKVTEAMGEFEETSVTDNMRGRINDKYGVDIDNAIRKEANRRTIAEQTAIDEYLDELIPKNAKERNTVEDAEAEDITNQKLLTDEPEATTPTNDAPIDPRFDNPTTPEYDPHQPGGEQKPVGRAVMKYQDRPVEVLSGRVVMMEDGTMIDNERSDASIVVRDLETGKVEMVSPDAILSYEGYPAEVEVPQDNVAPEAETPAEPQPKYTTGLIKIRNSDGTETRGVLTGFVDENGNHEYYVEGDLQHLHYASEHELDNILSEYTPDEPQEVKQPQPAEPQPVDPNRPTQEGVANVEDYDKGYSFGIDETQGISDSELTAKISELRTDAERLTDFGRGMLEAYEYEQQRRAMEQQLVPVDAETVPKTEETTLNPMETGVNITETVPKTEIPIENVQQSVDDGNVVVPAPATNEAPQVDNVSQPDLTAQAEPTPLQRIPRNEKNEPIFEQAESPEVGWDALVEFSEGDAATAKEIADSIMNGKQLMENSMENRALEEDQDLFGDITAQLSGSEYAMLKNQIEKEVRKLTAQRKSWEADQTYIHNRKRQIAGQNKEAEKRIAENKSYLEKVEAATVGDITVGKLSYPSVEAMEDFFTEQNKRKAELQEQVRKSGYSSRPATSDITISVGGFNFHVHTEINRETKQGQQGDLFYSAPAKMTYSCPELGIEAMPVKGNVIKNAVTEILNDVVSGEDFRGRIEAAERSIERNNAELQSISARDGVPFKFTEELAKAEEKLSEYEDLMKAEMEAKEAKYAELDKEVEAASNIELTEEDSEDAASEPIASYSEENANFASRYETQDGKTINYTSENAEGYGGLFDFDFSGENAGGNEVGMRSGANDLQRQGDTGLNRHNSRLDKEAGEFSLIERVFRESGSFNFTSGEKIESADDVAFIFSALEDAAKEHSFVVLVKDGKPTVVELGMGTFTATMVDIPTASLAYNRIQPDQVYFVHNHPSGNLMCSPQDVQMLRKIADISKVPVHGVIINLKTGKYGTFDTDNTSGVGQKRVPENESPLAVHTLDKQIFAPNYDPMEQPLVRGSEDVAKFLNSQRMGDRAKMSFIILSRAGRIVGNIHTPFTKLPTKSDEIARYISERVIQFGGESAILYGDFTHEGSKMVAYRNLKDNLNKVGGTTLLDVVNVEGNNTRSANDDGLLYEPGSEYGASPDSEIRYREVEDDAILTEFAEGKTVKAYRTMQVIDGRLYSPMATKVGGKTTPEIRLGVPEQSEEHPEIIKGTKIGRDGVEQGYVVIDKGLGKGTLTVAYNPYAHTSRTVLNDQFSAAYIRPNLVTVEVEVPESELTSGYRAHMAKDAVGEISWHSGSVSGQLAELGRPRRVILTRYDRPVRIVPFREVAQMIAAQLDGTDIAIPYNVVQPQLRTELERLGVAISEEATGTVTDEADFGKAEYVTDQEIERINARQQEMAQTSPEAKSSYAERMSKKFNTPIRIVADAKELTSDNAERQARMRKSKGFYAPATGEVVIVIPNNANVEDVAETVFHEVVAHKGLREMIGEENYDAFCDEVYDHLKDDLKEQVDEETTRRFMNEPGKGYAHARRVAVDELLGRMAEKGFEDFTKAERGIWAKLKAKVLEAINKFLGSLKLPKWVKLGDNELRYMLWRSHEKLRTKGDYVDMARDAAKRDELGLSSDARFRDGETGDIWKDQSIGLEERITNAAIRLSNNQSADLTLRNDAMRAVTNNLQSLLHSMRNRRGTAQSFVGADRKVEAGVVDAMNAQAMFDRSTVKRVSDLARILMQNGYLSGMTSGEMQRLLSAVKNATAMHDIADSVQKIMDIMVDNQLRNGEVSLRQLLAIRGSKVDARGVEVQGALDVDGQRTMEVVKKAISLTEDDITDRIAEALNRMSDPDQTIADQAAIEYAGLNMALDYVQNIANSKAEEKALRDSLKTAKEDRDAGRMTDDAYKQFIETTEDAIRKNKIERTEAYFNLVGRLSDSLRGSIENAKAFREAEKARISEIHHNANSDMEGRPTNEHHKDDWQDKFVNNGFVQFLFAPLGTFDQIMRVFGNKSANGEGYLWNRFMRGWVDCRNKELRGIKDKFAQLDEKAAELFGKSKTWGDIIRMERKLPKASVSFWDGGEMRDHELTQGNLLYIYMVDKMTDGRMKLRRMGITEQNVADIENFLDPRFKALGDWLQDDFLVATRNEYNETHKRMFGASMAAIENYFPLKILANARVDKEEDVNQQNRPDGITTKTGSIIKRRVNNLALDITGADALSVILDHITQMEHWSAYAEWNRDLNTLRTYKRFRNQVINMTTVYGGGRRLWENFNDLCLMAAGEYRPPIANLDKSAVNLAKGVTAAKVSFRMFTALKQLLSAPAYAPEVSTRAILKSIVNPYGDFKWCMENLPIFRERWHSRISGDPRLLKSDMDWKMWRSRVMELSSRIGMTPNAFVDAVTVSIGAKAMYETRLKQYIKEGYPTDAAEKRAMQDAAILFNQTQQSSESPFLSTMQVDRSWLSVLFTVFRNSAMSYTRQEFDAVRNLKRNLTPGQRAKSIEFMTKQILRDWNVDPESATDVERDKAEGAAKKRFRKQIKKDVIRLATFGFILEMAWNLGSYLPYIIFGDDEDEKDKMWDDAITHAYFGSVEGLSGGDVLSSFGNMWANGEWNRNQLSKDMPLASDINSIANKFIGGKNAEGINDIINLLVQMGVGMNPQSITDAAIAITDACGDDPALSHEAAIFVMRVLQVPQSQIDKMYFDEIGLSGEEASKLTPEQLAQRYAEYKVKRGTPLAPWSWGDEERLNKYSESAKDIMKERLDAQGDATVNEAYADFEARYKAVSEKAKEAKALMRTDYAAAAQAHAALQQDPDFTLYQRFGSLDKQLGRISKMWLTSKTPEEAALIASTIPAYRAGMVKVLQAETVENQQSAMSELTTLMNEFYSKYQAIQPQPQQLNR